MFVSTRQSSFASAAASFAAAMLIVSSFVAESHALIVGNQPGIVPATTVNPELYPGWSEGDPGWENHAMLGSNYVYLGDGWVLSARHVGYSTTNGVRLQSYLPDGSPGPIKSFFRIPGSYYQDYGYGGTSITNHRYAISNPASIQSETGQSISLTSSGGTLHTDLQLFRISEDPGLPAVHLPSAPMPTEFTRSTAPEVVFIGNGRSRVSTETHWNVTGSSPNLTWTETTGAGTHQGYKRTSTGVHRFGTNRLTDIRPNFNGDPTDSGAINYTQGSNDIYEPGDVVSDTSAVFPLQTNDGTHDIISMMTVFDKSSGIGSTPLEAQATGGNSGTSVFYKRSGPTPEEDRWELVGIVHAISTYEDQPGSTAVYGNSIIISDLWHYTQNYQNSITDIIVDHADYSLQGDINLSGTVTGTGAGSITTDDISAFVAGWGNDNELGVGDIESWKKGDLNRDGKTNVHDFLKLRNAFHGDISDMVIAQLFGEGGGPGTPGFVPEPSAAFLLAMGNAFLVLRSRRRR